jgi:hypothetical protein
VFYISLLLSLLPPFPISHTTRKDFTIKWTAHTIFTNTRLANSISTKSYFIIIIIIWREREGEGGREGKIEGGEGGRENLGSWIQLKENQEDKDHK